MQGLLIDLIGKPEGIIIWQLVYATQFTIYLSLIAFIGGGSIAALICFARICPSTTAQAIATAYIWLFQSVPLLMLLFLIGLGVPKLLGIDVDPWMAATISLLLFTICINIPSDPKSRRGLSQSLECETGLGIHGTEKRWETAV